MVTYEEHTIFFISFEPYNQEDIDTIIASIHDELKQLGTQGPNSDEIKKSLAKFENSFLELLEDNYSQAHQTAIHYLATGDEDGIFNYIHHDLESIKQEIQELAQNCMRPTICHTGMLLPLPESEQAYWKEIQDNINKADTLLLQDKERQSNVEQGKYVHTVKAQEPDFTNLPKPQVHTLKNGLKVLYYHNDNVPSIKMKLDLAADYWYEPTDKAPLFDLTCKMLLEGTKTYTKEQLLSEMEKRGVTIQIKIDGTISIASSPQEIQKACELCADIIANPLFTQENLDKLKKRAIATYMKFWDTPASIMAYLMGKHLYEEEGFFHNPVGTPESIERITLKILHHFMQSIIVLMAQLLQ